MHPSTPPDVCIPPHYDPHLGLKIYNLYLEQCQETHAAPSLRIRDLFHRREPPAALESPKIMTETVHQCFTCGHRSLRPLLAPKQAILHRIGVGAGAAAMLSAKMLIVCAVVAEPSKIVIAMAGLLGGMGYLLLNSSCSALGWRTPEQRLEHVLCEGYLRARVELQKWFAAYERPRPA